MIDEWYSFRQYAAIPVFTMTKSQTVSIQE